GAKTTIATANVIVDLVRTLVEGREVMVCGQVRLDGELSDLHVPVGVPVVIDARGWTQVVPLELWADEAQLIEEQLSYWQEAAGELEPTRAPSALVGARSTP